MNLLPEDQKPKDSMLHKKTSKDEKPEFTMHVPEKQTGEIKNEMTNTPDEIRKKLAMESQERKVQHNELTSSLAPHNNPFLSKSSGATSSLQRRAGRLQHKDTPIPQMPIRKGKGRISVNLVPEDTLRIVKKELPERLKYLALFLVLLVGLMLVGWGGLAWFQINTFTEIQEVRKEISLKEAEIHQYKTQSSEVIKLRERYDLVKVLLEEHVYWTKFFTLLERYTTPDVYYTSFSVKSDKGARITLNARARNVEAVAEQLRILQNATDFVEDVHVNGFSILTNAERRNVLSADDEVVAFDITMTLRDDVFLLTPLKT